jgi:tetratricopeptide (TPR) repeat protein
MRFHFIGDATERLFSRGQRLLARGCFEDAIQSFDRAIASDSSYAHIYVYKALALGELERYDQAIAQIDEATRLNSRNFVFSLYLGCIHFDEHRLDAAGAAFRQAASLDPGNTLVSSYQLLTEYVSGRKGALARLAPQLNSLPDSFKARLLVALRADEDVAGPIESAEVSSDRGKPSNLLGAVRRRLREWSDARLDRRLQRLFEANHFEQVLDLLRSHDLELSEDREALARQARTGASKELMTELSKLEEGRSAKAYKGRKELKRRAKVEEQRRGLLLRLANLRDTGAPQRYRDLERWIESYRAVDSPARTRELASEVLAEMADMARRSARLDSAIDLCQQSKSLGGAAEADWIEARSRLASGEPRLAKQLFERFGHSKSLVFSQRVADLLRARSLGPHASGT